MLSAVVQYSTLDFRFLEANLTQLSKCCDEIIIPICDHFFNGELESGELLENTYAICAKYPKCSVFSYEWQGPKSNSGYYHNLSRHLGSMEAKGDWLLHLDADEIVDDSFSEWFDSIKLENRTYWLTCYWYFRDSTNQATTTEGAGLLIRRGYCSWDIDTRDERQQFFYKAPNFVNGQIIPILSKAGTPMIHHFSWVRSKEEMLKKVKNWGHKGDRDNWIESIEEEFSRPFNGTDFVHGYKYTKFENKFNLK